MRSDTESVNEKPAISSASNPSGTRGKGVLDIAVEELVRQRHSLAEEILDRRALALIERTLHFDPNARAALGVDRGRHRRGSVGANRGHTDSIRLAVLVLNAYDIAVLRQQRQARAFLTHMLRAHRGDGIRHARRRRDGHIDQAADAVAKLAYRTIDRCVVQAQSAEGLLRARETGFDFAEE